MAEPVKEFKDGWDLIYVKDGVVYPVYLSDEQQLLFNLLIKPLIGHLGGKIAVMGNYALEAKKVNTKGLDKGVKA
jgi:hypothetical protein